MARADKFIPELHAPKGPPPAPTSPDVSVVLKCTYGERGPNDVVTLEATEARRLVSLGVAELA